MKLPRLGNGLPVAGAEKVLQEGGKGSARGLRNEGGGIDPEGGAEGIEDGHLLGAKGAGESIPQGRASRQGGGNDGYAVSTADMGLPLPMKAVTPQGLVAAPRSMRPWP